MSLDQAEQDGIALAGDETIIDRVMSHGRLAPDAPCVIIRSLAGDVALTRADLIAASQVWAQRFQALGLSKGDIVIIMIDHRADLLSTYLGAMIVGCVPSYMPYSTAKQDPDLYRKAHRDLFRRIKAKLVVTIDAWIAEHGEAFSDSDLRLLSVDGSLPGEDAQAPAGEHVAFQSSGDDIALLQHSSGTTDLKKGVCLSHRSVLAQAQAYGTAIELSPDDVIVSWLPLYHDMGLMACFILPLVNGVPVVMVDPFVWVRQPHLLLAAIEAFGGTLTWLPNFAFHHLVRTCAQGNSYDLSRMRAFINCSEPCKAATLREFEAAFLPMGVRRDQLQTCYAMAETTYAVTQSKLGLHARALAVGADRLSRTGQVATVDRDDDVATEFLSCGRPIEGTTLRIFDDQGNACADGSMGEVGIRSTSMFSGYFELPQATEMVFRDGWYLSGDLGFVQDGELYITGRKKEMFIVRGRNFFAHEVESVVNSCPGVKPGRAVAIGVFSDTLGSEEVIVIAESEIGDAQAKRQLSNAVKQALDERMSLQVRSVEIVEPGWLIKTTSGKISRKENLAKYRSEKQSRL